MILSIQDATEHGWYNNPELEKRPTKALESNSRRWRSYNYSGNQTMIIKEVTATCRRLIALPRYENVLYECTMTATVEDHENASDVYDDLVSLCKERWAEN